MITTIDKDGLLLVKAETDIESYALNKWVKDNIHECTGDINKESIGFDWSCVPLYKKVGHYKIEYIDSETVKLIEV
jgi:hypothetical protein